MPNCHVCSRPFTTRFSLNRHIESIHKIKVEKKPRPQLIRCRECSQSFIHLDDLRSHLRDKHEVENITDCDELTFPTIEEFYEWKEKEEESTNQKWILFSMKKNKSGSRYRIYCCCRSGRRPDHKKQKESQNETATGKRRRMKALGSRKIGSHCTSVMHVFEKNEVVIVEFYKHHYGHDDNRLGHVPLPLSVKKEVAGLLMQGKGVKEILTQMRLSGGDRLQRKHIITRKDVHNIKTSFGIHLEAVNEVKPKLEAEVNEFSVDAWVKGLEDGSPNLVRFYKRLGEDCHGMSSDDFVVILMSDFQKRKLLEFGCDRICIDSTFGIAGYDLQLTTVLVMDHYEEGLPVAFCLSSSLDTAILETFITAVKVITGPITCTVFVSHDDLRLFKAWEEVMGPPEHILLSAWHVDRAWQGNLHTVANKAKRDRVYNCLKACQLQLDEEIFEVMYSSLVNDLREDDETIEFSNYLSSTFGTTHKLWAYCYRIGLFVNTNMYIEHFHKLLERQNKRLDKFLSALIHYDFDKEIKYQTAQMTKRMTSVVERHSEGMELISSVVPFNEEVCWKVPAADFEQTGTEYLVVKIIDHICDSKCAVRCETCKVCLKAAICSCPDNAISGHMCEHIHAAMIHYLNQVCDEDGMSNPRYPEDSQWSLFFEEDSCIADAPNPPNRETRKPPTVENPGGQVRQLLDQIRRQLDANRSYVSPIVAKDVVKHLKSVKNLLSLKFKEDHEKIGDEVEIVNIENKKAPSNKKPKTENKDIKKQQQPVYEFYFTD